MPKILALSNSPFTNTGYATQIRNVARCLKELGYRVDYISNYGLQGAQLEYGDSRIYPMPIDDSTGTVNPALMLAFVKHSRADIVLSLWDIWALPVTDFGLPWIAYFPIDGTPVSKPMLEKIRRADYPVVYSQFGQEETRKAGVFCHYVPHGINTEIFKPGDKAEARRTLNIPDDLFLVTTVAANKGYPARKAWPELLCGFAEFNKRHPRSLLYLHTTRKPAGPGPAGGMYFDDLVKELEIPQDAVAFPDQNALAIGIVDEMMAIIYQASDVMLCPSMAEGFGLPIAEAEACGCPVITQACSSMTELTVNGIAIEPLQKFWVTQLNYWWQLPSIERIAAALEEVYRWSPKKRRKMSEKGVAYIQNKHAWPVVSEHWRELIERVAAQGRRL